MAALFFIPPTVPAFWWGLSRHSVELVTVCPHVTALLHPPLLPVPVFALCLAPHRRSLSTDDRLEQTPLPPMLSGIGNKGHCCVGCHQGFSLRKAILRCGFADSGFVFSNGEMAHPCKISCTVLRLFDLGCLLRLVGVTQEGGQHFRRSLRGMS
jgi:hypothetical protein